MKTLGAAVAAVVGVATFGPGFVSAQIGAPDPDFDTWVQSSGKVYSSPEEAAYRRTVFDANKARIDSINAVADGYTVGVNEFADLTSAEFKSLRTGLLMDAPVEAALQAGQALDFTGGDWGSGWESSDPLGAWKEAMEGTKKRPSPSPTPAPPAPEPAVPSASPAAPSVDPSPSSAPAVPSPSSSSAPAIPSASSSKAPVAPSASATRSPVPSASSSRAPVPSATPSASRAPVGPVAPSTAPAAPSAAPSAPPAGTNAVDWTTKGVVQAIKNQGSCGSCWAFAASAVVESAWAIKTGTLYSLSEQQQLDCSSSVNSGCNGGQVGGTLNWIAKSSGGLCAASSYPYTGTQGSCKSCSALVTTTGYASVTSNSQAALEAAVRQQPVEVAIQADQQAFQFYKSGVITAGCGTSLNHAVVVVGYGTDATKGGYYKVKNSWGTGWGEGGYVRIGRGTAYGANGLCGIQMQAAYPKV